MIINFNLRQRAFQTASRVLGLAPVPEPATAWAAIETGRVTAQGPVMRRYRDGRVAISTGRGEVVGRPVR